MPSWLIQAAWRFLRQNLALFGKWLGICAIFRILNYPATQESRARLQPFPLASELVLCFGLIGAILLAIGGISFFSLRSLGNLNGRERASTHPST
jgi:hypothetical protein